MKREPSRFAARPSAARIAPIASAVAGCGKDTPRAFVTVSRTSSSRVSSVTSNASAASPSAAEPPKTQLGAAIATVAASRRTAIHTSGASALTSPRSFGPAHASIDRAAASIASRFKSPRRCRKRDTPPDTSSGKRTPPTTTASSVTSTHASRAGRPSSMPSPSFPIASRSSTLGASRSTRARSFAGAGALGAAFDGGGGEASFGTDSPWIVASDGARGRIAG